MSEPVFLHYHRQEVAVYGYHQSGYFESVCLFESSLVTDRTWNLPAPLGLFHTLYHIPQNITLSGNHTGWRRGDPVFVYAGHTDRAFRLVLFPGSAHPTAFHISVGVHDAAASKGKPQFFRPWSLYSFRYFDFLYRYRIVVPALCRKALSHHLVCCGTHGMCYTEHSYYFFVLYPQTSGSSKKASALLGKYRRLCHNLYIISLFMRN